MNTQQLTAVAWLAVAVPACSDHDMTMMSDYAQDLGRHVEAMRSEQSAHSLDVAAASDSGFAVIRPFAIAIFRDFVNGRTVDASYRYDGMEQERRTQRAYVARCA